jgi:transcriptional regulator with XRE-family HTH domain
MKHKDFGAVLKAGRTAKFLSTREVSSLTGISYSAISRYEREGTDPSFAYMILMCDLYDIELNDMANFVHPTSHNRDHYTTGTDTGHTKSDATLGAVLKAGRKRTRSTTRAVEAVTGISNVNIHRYETDEQMPSFTPTVILCDLYGIYVNDLAYILRRRSIT